MISLHNGREESERKRMSLHRRQLNVPGRRLNHDAATLNNNNHRIPLFR